MAERRAVIGIYGLPGCGKSLILTRLGQIINKRNFDLVEGSSKIASFCGEQGLEGFKLLDEEAKNRIRERAILAIAKDTDDNARDAIVTGHFSFWEEGHSEPLRVWTDADAATYTNIIYLRVDPAELHERRRMDAVTIRPQVSVEHLRKWQDAEVQSLRRLCTQKGILFIELKEQQEVLSDRVHRICTDHRRFHERTHYDHVKMFLDALIERAQGALSTVLLVDGDRTLSPEDTGRLFWTAEPPLGEFGAAGTPTERLFRDHGYSLFAFHQAALLYEEALDEFSFPARCHKVAQGVKLYPELETLIRKASARKDILVIVVTSGITKIWDAIIKSLALPTSGHITVLGGAHWPWSTPLAVTPEVKGQVAALLREVHGLDVWAFGDSPIDIPMLKAAHHAIVVVGNEESRSRSMEAALSKAVSEGLQAKQLLLPSDAPPRLDLRRLPPVTIQDIMADLQRGSNTLTFLHATDKEASKLLASPTRDPSISGPDLKRATARIGQYLALEYLSTVLGLAPTPSKTVQGKPTMSHSLRDEPATAIVAIMRAGEPLAEGIFDVFPRARFIHARKLGDLTARDLEGVRAVLLVDTVINTGGTMIEFVQHVRGLDLGMGNGDGNGDGNGSGNGNGKGNSKDEGVRIVVVASVVQAETVQRGHPMAEALVGAGATLVALRVSENKYKGTKGLDTGNRMFNTTHKD